MDMIWHTVYGDQFLPLALNNACNISVYILFMFSFDEAISALNGENYMGIKLCVCICHNYLTCSHVAPDGAWIINMTLFYKRYAPTGLRWIFWT